jgi:hypothetical protein
MTHRLALLLCLFSSAAAGFAQLSTQPPPSSDEGVHIRPFAGSGDEAAWGMSALADYRNDQPTPFVRPAAGGTDVFGRTWDRAAPSRALLADDGGTVRTIFLGEAAGVDGAGYSYLGVPNQDSFTLTHGPATPAGLAFGNRTDLSLMAGEATPFDLWIQRGQAAYTLFDPGKSLLPANVQADVLWTTQPLLVNTYLGGIEAYADVETWIVSVLLQDPTATTSALEARFAVQLFGRDGWGGGEIPAAPEPSTYALLGSAACLAAAWLRRRRRQG